MNLSRDFAPENTLNFGRPLWLQKWDVSGGVRLPRAGRPRGNPPKHPKSLPLRKGEGKREEPDGNVNKPSFLMIMFVKWRLGMANAICDAVHDPFLALTTDLCTNVVFSGKNFGEGIFRAHMW